MKAKWKFVERFRSHGDGDWHYMWIRTDGDQFFKTKFCTRSVKDFWGE